MAGFSAEVTPVILTRDEEPNIGRSLGQLKWAREIVVVDSASRDRTTEIANSFPNVKIFTRPFDNLASQWEFGVSRVSTDWVLTLDADYFVTDALVAEIELLDPSSDVDGFEAQFFYAIGGRPLRGSLYPPRIVLVRRGSQTFFMDGHTQRVRVEGRVVPLRERIVHDDRKPFVEFVNRQKRYMKDEAAKIRQGRDLTFAGKIRRLRVIAPLAAPLHALFIKGAILDGWRGILYAWERFVAEAILSRELFRTRHN